LGNGTTTNSDVPVRAVFITAVDFTGSATSPTVIVDGSGFGTQAALGTPHAVCGGSYTGSDYGTALYLYDATQGWTAGYEVTGNCDSIGIIISSYSNNQIVFTFGSAYSNYSLLNASDFCNLNLLGASVAGTVAFLP
jgi:hypothetical protein